MIDAGASEATGAIILGGEYRGLGVVRSLGRRGIPVWVLSDENRIAATSRYAQRALRWIRSSDREQLVFLLTLIGKQKLQGWTLFPTNDEDAAFIARNHDQLSRVLRLTTPAWDQLCWAYDKRLTIELARRSGVDHPWTFCPRSRADLANVSHSGPLILKPAIKPRFNAFTHAKAWPVRNHGELVACYEVACRLVDPSLVMVQEVIPGGGIEQYSFAALCRDGEPIAWLTARRLRQYPLDFGRASTCVETVDAPPVEASARRLLADIGYTGLIEIEYKRDPRDGRYKLLDLNPRIWGWHTIGQRAGVDFSYLQWQMSQGEPVPTLRGRPNVRWIRLATDLPAALRLLALRQLGPIEYVRSLLGPVEFAMLAPDDPLPALLDLPLLLMRALVRGAA
jgi:predicted ATP-grasp superfamily ATP-dependent carboligase